MSMPVSEKNFLEKLASEIPGLVRLPREGDPARDRPPYPGVPAASAWTMAGRI